MVSEHKAETNRKFIVGQNCRYFPLHFRQQLSQRRLFAA